MENSQEKHIKIMIVQQNKPKLSQQKISFYVLTNNKMAHFRSRNEGPLEQWGEVMTDGKYY